jgi:uncharacterized protein YecE (DUF72 family)
LQALAEQLPPNLYFGTSSWSYPGWHGITYDGQYTESLLSRKGLRACGQHPLLRAAGIDRGFYGPIPLADYLNYASQVPEDFRFLVKAPASVCDAWLRGPDGAGRLQNAAFLNAEIAIRDFIEPATSGLGPRCGPCCSSFRRWLAWLTTAPLSWHGSTRSLPNCPRWTAR